MNKFKKRGLSLVTVLAVAFTMCFGTMTASFAADSDPQIDINVNGKTVAVITAAQLDNGTDKKVVKAEETGLTLEHIFAAVDVPDNAVIDVDTTNDKYKGTTIDTFANFKAAGCFFYHRTDDDRNQIDCVYDDTVACIGAGGSQKNVCALNITIPEPCITINGIEIAMSDLKSALKSVTKTADFAWMNSKGTTGVTKVTGVAFADVFAMFGIKNVTGVKTTATDGYASEFAIEDLVQPDITGQVAFLAFETDGDVLDYPTIVVGQKSPEDINKGKWARDISVIDVNTVSVGKVKGVKVKKAKKGVVKVSWTPLKANATGYQISQVTSKSKTKVVKTVKKIKTKSVTIKAKKGKQCYYKVRAIYKDGGISVNGSWSKVVSYKLK